MEVVSEKKEDGKIELSVQGRVDTNTAPKLQAEILDAFQKSSNIRLNLEKVEYVSSAGLRALLIGQKTAQTKKGSMVLFNVQDAVFEVFNMTGFVNVLQIEK